MVETYSAIGYSAKRLLVVLVRALVLVACAGGCRRTGCCEILTGMTSTENMGEERLENGSIYNY